MRKFIPLVAACLVATTAAAQDAGSVPEAQPSACSFPCAASPTPEAAPAPDATPSPGPAVSRRKHAKRNHGTVARDQRPGKQRVASAHPRETVTEEIIEETTIARPKKVRTISIKRPGSMPVEEASTDTKSGDVKSRDLQEAARETQPAPAPQKEATQATAVAPAVANAPSPFGGLSRLGLQ